MNPYASLGLARNPFVAEPAPGVDGALWLDRGLPDPPRAIPASFVQVLGAKGIGKTSHLLRWREREPGPYRHVPPGAGRFRPLPVAPVVYWDEADRVPLPLLRLALRRAARCGAAVRCGTHRDLAGVAAGCGLRVAAFAPPPIDGAAILEWSRLRVEAVRLAEAGGWWELDAEEAAALADSSRDWRAVADRLHTLVADAAAAALRA